MKRAKATDNRQAPNTNRGEAETSLGKVARIAIDYGIDTSSEIHIHIAMCERDARCTMREWAGLLCLSLKQHQRRGNEATIEDMLAK